MHGRREPRQSGTTPALRICLRATTSESWSSLTTPSGGTRLGTGSSMGPRAHPCRRRLMRFAATATLSAPTQEEYAASRGLG
jgi:hypothetical protein